MPGPRVILFADRDHPEVAPLYERMRDWIDERAEIAGEFEANGSVLPEGVAPDLAVVFGGDGTLLTQGRALADRNLPLVGVNFGRLGFLAEFDWQSLQEHADVVFGGSPPVHEHMMFDVAVANAEGVARHEGIAINDAVVRAPLRMIELKMTLDGERAPSLMGDGVIVATPTGSTAYSVSAGGPIVGRGLTAIILTPLAPHSLAFRPIVLRADALVDIEVARDVEDTALILDGQVTIPLHFGDRVTITRSAHIARFVTNPSTTFWRIVKNKLNWAAAPVYRRPTT